VDRLGTAPLAAPAPVAEVGLDGGDGAQAVKHLDFAELHVPISTRAPEARDAARELHEAAERWKMLEKVRGAVPREAV
jgi:hypothetical protein